MASHSESARSPATNDVADRSSPKAAPSIAVAIASVGRKGQLTRTLGQLAKQVAQPKRVLVCVVEENDIESALVENSRLNVEVLYGPRGSCAQRNVILDAVGATADVVLFLDDDFYPAPDYCSHVARIMRQYPDVSVLTSWPELDGAPGPGISEQEALRALTTMKAISSSDYALVETYGGYGCNMAVRTSNILSGRLRFDERLVHYGWLEDIDFSRRAAEAGRIVGCSHLRGVHLGVKHGRTSGLRLGYSQVVNPIYLVKKGSIGPRYAVKQVTRNLSMNAWKSLRPEPWVDRRGRLLGNLLGLMHLVHRAPTPELVLSLGNQGSVRRA